MDQLRIKGGIPLRGKVQVSGAKNAALPIMAASIAVGGNVTLNRVPRLRDIESMRQLLNSLGISSTWSDENSLLLAPFAEEAIKADYSLVSTMRASICVLGPLLGSRGKAIVSLPGGCNIGHRPIDLHLKGLEKMGAEIQIRQGYIEAEAKQLHGTRINLAGPFGSTVTGTCNMMTAACFASGTTIIESAAKEPEVVDLGEFLQAAGASIEGLGSETIVIEGSSELNPIDYTIIPDRIEAATWLLAAAATRGNVVVDQLCVDHLQAVLHMLQSTGVRFEIQGNSVRISEGGDLVPVDLEATPYPGLPTDVQAQATAFLAKVLGTSQIRDAVFPDRFMHAAELMRMGARLQRIEQGVTISGVELLSGAQVMASDLRASAALVIAALTAEGTTTIRRIYHLDRGYERLAEKLAALGADVVREPEPKSSISGPHWGKQPNRVDSQAF